MLHWHGCTGYKLRVGKQATLNITKNRRHDHGQGSPERSDSISDAIYERAVAHLTSHGTIRKGQMQ